MIEIVLVIGLMIVSLVIFAWGMANSRREREQLDESVKTLGAALRQAVEPPLERCVRTLNRWLTRGKQ